MYAAPHAAAPCPVPVQRAMIDWLGPIVREYYGATEANGFTFCDSADWLAHPGTVGRAVLGQIVVRDEQGRECPPDTGGVVWFRGATNFECPRSVDFVAELPRLPTGKLYKRLLRDRYWEGHASRISWPGAATGCLLKSTVDVRVW